MRPNFFVNTPDILHAYLQYGGPAAFKIRAVLAATGSPSWGVYAGYELFEHVAVKPGSEEYLDSEKYQIRIRDWDAAGRRGPHAGAVPHPAQRDPPRAPGAAAAAQRHDPQQRRRERAGLLASRLLPDGDDDTVIVVVNLDPHGARETTVHLDMPALGLDWHDSFVVHDEITGADWSWGQHNYVRLDPGARARPRADGQEAPLTERDRRDLGRVPRHPRGARHRRPTGSRPPSSTRCWSARSATPTATAPATSRG